MKFLQRFLDRQQRHFQKGGRLEKFYSIFEMVDTFIFTPSEVTQNTAHVRDGLDLKRVMITVGYALIPCGIMALYNTGFQANLSLSEMGYPLPRGWRMELMYGWGLEFDPHSILSNMVHGGLYFIPVFLVTNIVGGFWEALFASIRKHEINEGFLVTGLLFPLTLPPTIPLWQVALGVSFGVVVGKEIFGGTGRNIFNPALMGRAFLFFSYPAQMSGDLVWTAVDGHTGATPLGLAAMGGMDTINHTWEQAFIGLIPGSMGETSTIACLLGAVILIGTGIGSWKIMASCTLGAIVMALFLNLFDPVYNPIFSVTVKWHLVLGGFAFATVFMATDPVSSAMTEQGKWIYGFLIGLLGILIRSVNPAYPEGWMLAILFMNAFAPLIDYFIVKKNINRRNRGYV
ncbi:MAG: NADH:ubiquinone reductase (Na(+)-transporting) subunit B [Halobacteriovoraceae bacterium]|nr:NADH:ubiquinone reductase (Na(+)-transporting) subunit B [Halobacteriovoraceae bacterium]